MFVQINVLVLFIFGLSWCNCSEDEWGLYERSFRNAYREEIYVANATENSNLKTNFTVERWKTLTVGRTCYSGGITNDSYLVILFTTLSEDGLEKIMTANIFNFEFFHRRKNGIDKIMLVAYLPVKQQFLWYTLDHDQLNKVETWSLEKDVSHFSLYKMENKNLFFAIATNSVGKHSADIYDFTIEPLERRFYQSIPLPYAATSSCFNTIDSISYLSIPQTPLGQLEIYQFSQDLFTPFQNISAPEINQVVCFENGFKSFIAFNGLNASIYEFTEDGLIRETIVNSNLQGIQFWLPIPVNTYRDETILLCQRKLDHETHFSFDVDIVTYNGKRFEEHEDIPCLLFGEEQNGLKCLAEYDQNTGIMGSSYIAVGNHLSLIIPIANSTSLLFDLNVGTREVEHPAKKEFDTYIKLKDMLQVLIENQTKEYNLLLEQRKIILDQKTTLEKKNQLGTTSAVLSKAKPRENSKSKILELRDEIEEVVKDLEDLQVKATKGGLFTQNNDSFRNIVFNAPVEILGELRSERINSNLIGGKETDYLLRDIVRKNHFETVGGQKTFSDLTVKDINFENVNGILSNTFVTSNSPTVQLNGDLVFSNLVNTQNIDTTSTLVNRVNIKNEWIYPGGSIKAPLEFEQLKVRNTFNSTILINPANSQGSSNLSTTSDEFSNVQHESIFISGNVTVKTLNGQNFESFLRKLCYQSLECHMPSLRVKGAVNCKRNVRTTYLNNLQFPQGYVGLEFTKVLNITGFKEFTDTVRGYKIFADSKVNNIDLSKIITRSYEQKLTGNITFDDLEIASALQVDGDVKGQGLEKFVPNLGLTETKTIKSNVYLHNLEVQGNIIVENGFNGTHFSEYLQDFIFNDEENVVINGLKKFPEGFTTLNNLHIDSNTINNLSLSSLIPKDSNQELQISTIFGTVDFDNLYVKEEFDGNNITELNRTLVRLSDNQTIDSTLIFLEHVDVNNLSLVELNGLNQNDTRIPDDSEIVFENLDVEILEIEGDIIGDVNEFDLKELREDYLSYTKDQIISEPYFVHKLTLDYVKPKNINDVDSNKMFSYEQFKGNVTDFLLYRNPSIKNLNVEGSLDIKTMNDKDFNQMVQNDVWIKMYHNGSSKFLTINGNVYFDTLQIQNLADANFNEYINSLIFKNETDVNIEGLIIFENSITVEKLIETQTLNDVPLENILRQDGEQTLLGPVTIWGDVTVEDDLEVREMVNNVDVRFIEDNLNIDENATTMIGEVMFRRLAYIHNLIINGTINGLYFDNEKSKFVYTNEDIDLRKNTLFKETVNVNENMGITNDVNGINLSDFVSQVVWITQDTDIQGPIRFTNPVVCYKSLNVEKELNTQLLFGRNFEEHVNKGVFVDKGLIQGLFTFDNIIINENLNTQFVNNLNMSMIIPLKSDQHIDKLKVTEFSIFHNIDVGGRVNGVQLTEELKRTALKNIDQEIQSEVVFLNNVLIEDNLVAPKINNKSTSKIVTTNTNQDLTATYSFNTKCWADGNLAVHGLINGINLTLWKNALPMNLENSQNIEEQWTVTNDLNLVGPVSGDGIMNGITISKFISDAKEKELYRCNIEKGLFNNYENICTDITYIYENSKKQIYKFKYFEEFQKLSFTDPVHYVKYFQAQGRDFLLVNEHQSCLSHLMEFRQYGFYAIRDVHTGIINQAEVARDGDSTFLVTRGEDSKELVCKISFSTVVWAFKNQDLQVLTHIENQELLEESQIPSTFYGFRHGVVTEFKIEKSSAKSLERYRKWDVSKDNVAFFPRYLKTGLALRTGKHIIFLNRDEPIVDEDFGFNTDTTILGTFSARENSNVPGRVGGDITVTNVGIKRTRKSLIAVASHMEAKVEHRLDIIEIYQDPFKGELFDKIRTYRPSCMTSVEFENGETLLAFMEEQKILQIYEYKGVEGFKRRSSIKMPASQLLLMELPIAENLMPRKVLGLVHKNEITLLQAVMVGNKIEDGLSCHP